MIDRSARVLTVRATEPGPHLGADTTALVDGRLSGWARDRALGHVSVCPSCRADVEEQRRLKAHIADLGTPQAPADLMSRLLDMRPSVSITPPPVSAAPIVGGIFSTAAFVAAPARPAGAPRSVKHPLVAGIAGVGLLAGGLALGVALRSGGPAGGGSGRVVDPMLTAYTAPPTDAPMPRTRLEVTPAVPEPLAR